MATEMQEKVFRECCSATRISDQSVTSSVSASTSSLSFTPFSSLLRASSCFFNTSAGVREGNTMFGGG